MVNKIANHLRSPVAINEAIIKVKNLQRNDKSFEEALTLMGESLIKERKRKYRISVA